jgi:hypothetical protein
MSIRKTVKVIVGCRAERIPPDHVDILDAWADGVGWTVVEFDPMNSADVTVFGVEIQNWNPDDDDPFLLDVHGFDTSILATIPDALEDLATCLGGPPVPPWLMSGCSPGVWVIGHWT